MDLPPPTKFAKYNEKILEAVKRIAESSTKAATQDLEADMAANTNNPVEPSLSTDVVTASCGGIYFRENLKSFGC